MTVNRTGTRVTVTHGGATVSWNTAPTLKGDRPFKILANAKPGHMEDLSAAVAEAWAEYPSVVEEPPPDPDDAPRYEMDFVGGQPVPGSLRIGGRQHEPQTLEDDMRTTPAQQSLEELEGAMWCHEHGTTLQFCGDRKHYGPEHRWVIERDNDGPDYMPVRDDLQTLINSHSQENVSNTPDFVIAEFLQTCLDALNTAIAERDRWYSIRPHPGWSGEFWAADQPMGVEGDADR